MSKKKVVIYTDGAAEPNPGPGGYGVVLISGENRKELSRGFRFTTNSRMELLAVIAGLETLKESPLDITIYSDSKYVVDAVNQNWIAGWKKKNWEKVKNTDLWKRFLSVHRKHNVNFKWVPGHRGIEENERCDQLAVEACKSANLQVDEGYEKSHASKTGIPPRKKVERKTNLPKIEKVCRHCSKPMIKKKPERKKLKPKQKYYYEWYFYCNECGKMYLAEEAKRPVGNQQNKNST